MSSLRQELSDGSSIRGVRSSEQLWDWRYVGTHTGSLRSPDGVEVPATGKQFDFPFVAIFRVQGGKIRSIRIYYDQVELFTQLGLFRLS